MCGICSISRAERTSIKNGRDFAVNAVRAIESRGRHATGFGWAEKGQDEHVWFDKQQGPATKVAHHLGLPGKGIHTLIGHTRHYTLGSPAVYENNHPVVADHIVAAHNGRISNHAELVALTGREREAEVDSWALPALLAADLGADHPTEVLELVEGVAAVTWLSADEPGVLHLARMAQRPMFIGWTKRGDLVMSSTKSTLELTGRLNKVHIRKITEVREGTYLRVEAGKITERRQFKFNGPRETIAEDEPGKGKRKRAVAGSKARPKVTELRTPRLFDADDLDWWAEYDKREAAERASIERAMEQSKRDGIDWEELVPRRGWKIKG